MSFLDSNHLYCIQTPGLPWLYIYMSTKLDESLETRLLMLSPTLRSFPGHTAQGSQESHIRQRVKKEVSMLRIHYRNRDNMQIQKCMHLIKCNSIKNYLPRKWCEWTPQQINWKNNYKIIKRFNVFGEAISKQISETNMNRNNNPTDAQEKQKHIIE